jgi:hypothetical protein
MAAETNQASAAANQALRLLLALSAYTSTVSGAPPRVAASAINHLGTSDRFERSHARSVRALLTRCRTGASTRREAEPRDWTPRAAS